MSAIAGIRVGALTEDGNLKVEDVPRSGTEKYFYLPNFCDRRTWYQDATPVVELELTDSGNHLDYESGEEFWIDLTHGRQFDEDSLLLDEDFADRVVKIEVQTGGVGDWVEKTEDEWLGTVNDYSVDYETGIVTFHSVLGATDKVRASFCKAQADYEYRMAPYAGTKVMTIYAETQFTADVELTGSLVVEIWAYNPEDFPNKMMVYRQVFKRVQDIYSECTGPFPVMPAFGGAERGCAQSMYTFPFHYLARRDILSSIGMEFRIKLSNGAYGGTFATGTFYCMVEAEEA